MYPHFDGLTCQVCGKVGHFALHCWHRFERQYSNSCAGPNSIHSSFKPHANLLLVTPTTIFNPN